MISMAIGFVTFLASPASSPTGQTARCTQWHYHTLCLNT
jgi:hypothetical protein